MTEAVDYLIDRRAPPVQDVDQLRFYIQRLDERTERCAWMQRRIDRLTPEVSPWPGAVLMVAGFTLAFWRACFWILDLLPADAPRSAHYVLSFILGAGGWKVVDRLRGYLMESCAAAWQWERT